MIRFGGIYMRGRQGQRCVMSLYQEQYIVKLFPQYLNDFHVSQVIYNIFNLMPCALFRYSK